MSSTTPHFTSHRVAAVAAAAGLAAGALANVPAAHATCASFFGFGSRGECTSNLTSIAVAIGQSAQAHADGFLGAALTIGASSTASTTAGALLNLAVTFGERNTTNAGGIGSLAISAGSTKQTVLAGDGGLGSGNIANLAVSLASPDATETIANGIANLTTNIAGTGNVYGRGNGLITTNIVGLAVTLYNSGSLNNVTNLVGNGTFISNLEGGFGNSAFNVIGEGNAIYTRGPLAIAGIIGSTGQTVTQSGPGITLRFNRQSANRMARRPAPAATEATSVAAEVGQENARRTRGSR